MIEPAHDSAVEKHLRAFLAAELRQAESDYPHLEPRASRVARGHGLRSGPTLAIGAVVVVVALAAWTGLRVFPPSGQSPTVPVSDPVGPDGIPLSLGGEPVLRGAAIEAQMATAGETKDFLAGGYLVLHSPDCTTGSPSPSAACTEDWRLDDAQETPGNSIRLDQLASRASFVRTSGAATVVRVRASADASGLALFVESIPWRQPTKGRIPDTAVPPQGGDVQMALVPDFIGVWGGPNGDVIVGYAPKDLLLNPRDATGGTPENPPESVPIPVYGEDLTTLIGYSVPGKGFVPLGVDPSSVPDPSEQQPSSAPSEGLPASVIDWGPLAVVPPSDGSDTARIDGTVLLSEHCVVLDAGGARTLLVWPADRAAWVAAGQVVRFDNGDGTSAMISDGAEVVLGGSGGTFNEDGPTFEAWLRSTTWVVAPATSCGADDYWFVGDAKTPRSSATAPSPRQSGLVAVGPDEAVLGARAAAAGVHPWLGDYPVVTAEVRPYADVRSLSEPLTAPELPDDRAVWFIVLASPESGQGETVLVDAMNGEVLQTVAWIS